MKCWWAWVRWVSEVLIVPSTMELLGARNWWLPGWLDRILPNLNVEGSVELSRRAEDA